MSLKAAKHTETQADYVQAKAGATETLLGNKGREGKGATQRRDRGEGKQRQDGPNRAGHTDAGPRQTETRPGMNRIKHQTT